MKSPKDCFQQDIAPFLSRTELEALHLGLINNDPDLIQGRTVEPPFQYSLEMNTLPIFAACAIGYGRWKSQTNISRNDVVDFFYSICIRVDELYQGKGMARPFLNWYDETPRHDMRSILTEWISELLNSRNLITP